MRIRDRHATINGCKETTEFPNGIDIITEDGKTILSVCIEDFKTVSIWCGDYYKSSKVVLEDRFFIIPHSTNVFYVRRSEHKKG
jgi:hypothetical protein